VVVEVVIMEIGIERALEEDMVVSEVTRWQCKAWADDGVVSKRVVTE
jgi:hypothetical protein